MAAEKEEAIRGVAKKKRETRVGGTAIQPTRDHSLG